MKAAEKETSAASDSKEAAIKNMGGLVWLYEKHILLFRQNYAGSAAEVERLLKEDRYTEARTYIHSIKGLAGTLGLDQLYLSASALEKALSAADPAPESQITEYKNHLIRFISGSE